MYEYKNILDATYGAHVVNGMYGGINNSNRSSTQAPVSNQLDGVVRGALAGNIEGIRQSARGAGNAVSMIQIFTDSIETIAEKLIKILELAKKALGPDFSQTQAEEMQKQFRNLAEEINQTANSTEYKFDKPFAGSGKTFSIPTGNGSKIDIFTRDFRFEAQGLNIATDPQNAISTVNEAITSIYEYKTYLDGQAKSLEDIAAAIELEIQGAMGVNMMDCLPELAVQMADYAASLISQDKQTSLNTQANLTPDEILKLLKDKN